MKKSTPRSEWEDIHGFDRTKRKYIRLDSEAWLAAHRIREEGGKRGKRNQPGPNETLPDEMYRRIEAWVRKRALDCKEEVGKYVLDELNNLHEFGSSWGQQNPEIGLDALVTQRCQDLRAKAGQNVSDLDNQRSAYKEAARDLRDFRQQHHLARVAHYPSNQFAHWLWVPVAGIVESFLSANLLGSVSRGGVIEGWMVALVLTGVNVLLGICAGQMWRFTHYRWGFMKLFAYFLSATCAAAALVWNDVAGHVRDIYVRAEQSGNFETIDKAFAEAYGLMIERPVPWESLASAGLAFVGVAVFFLTTYKMHTADDAFPAYGAKHRKDKALRERYQANLNDALEDLGTARNEANVAIEEIKNRYEMDRAGWENTLDKLHSVVKEYPVNLRQYNHDLAYLLAAYRSANLAERTDPPPPFFDSELTIDEDALQPPELAVPIRPEWGDIPEKTKTGFAQVEQTYKELLTRYQMLDQVIDDYAEGAP